MDRQRECKPENHQKSVNEILKKRFPDLTDRDHRVLAADLLAIPEQKLTEALRSRNVRNRVLSVILFLEPPTDMSASSAITLQQRAFSVV